MNFTQPPKIFLCALALVLLLVPGAEAKSVAPVSFYATPEEAVTALTRAVQSDDTSAVLRILGTQDKSLADSGNPEVNAADRTAFMAAYGKKHTLVPQGERLVLEIGDNNWPFPVPLTKDPGTGRWFFDGKAGAEEILDRRIGRNELSAMEVCRAYADAQRDYYRLNPEKSQVPHFAKRIVSTPGKRDGLYWPHEQGEKPSPLGALMAGAASEGSAAAKHKGDPYHGYRYRILTSQGKSAPGGSYSYIENTLMFGGFALVAYPAAYGSSGIMTFIISHDGTLYEKDFGKNTSTLAAKLSSFDPDASWRQVKEPSQEGASQEGKENSQK